MESNIATKIYEYSPLERFIDIGILVSSGAFFGMFGGIVADEIINYPITAYRNLNELGEYVKYGLEIGTAMGTLAASPRIFSPLIEKCVKNVSNYNSKRKIQNLWNN